MFVSQCCQSLGFCPKSQDFLSLNLLIIIFKLSVLEFPFNMVPLSSIHYRIFYQALMIL